MHSRLNENSHLLQPPINNYCVYNKDMTVMVSQSLHLTLLKILTYQIVGGPNARTDYHINETPEWFYQHKGSMLLKIVDKSPSTSSSSTSQPSESEVFRDIHIHEGDMFLLPPNTPHNPVRFANTVGIVIEQPRPEGSLDRLRWYCQNCGEKVNEEAFHCTDLGSQIKEAVNAFRDDERKRTCKSCGTLCDVAPPPKKVEYVRKK